MVPPRVDGGWSLLGLAVDEVEAEAVPKEPVVGGGDWGGGVSEKKACARRAAAAAAENECPRLPPFSANAPRPVKVKAGRPPHFRETQHVLIKGGRFGDVPDAERDVVEGA